MGTMEVSEYFLKGKMYTYGGIQPAVYDFYWRVKKQEPRLLI